MIGGAFTYEVALEDCRIPGWKLLGVEDQGFAPMQLRLGTRRMEMAAWCIGISQRALEMMLEYAPQRKNLRRRLSPTARRCRTGSPTPPPVSMPVA